MFVYDLRVHSLNHALWIYEIIYFVFLQYNIKLSAYVYYSKNPIEISQHVYSYGDMETKIQRLFSHEHE